MATDKERIEKLKRDLGNAFSDVNTLKTTNTELKTKNAEIILELKKSNQALDKAQELINTKKDELPSLLDQTEEAMTKLQDEINELKTINADLEAQVDELKTQSTGTLTKSLAILGVFASGAWVVAGIGALINTIRNRTS